MIENECKAPYGCLTFIFYEKYFYDKIDLSLSYFHVKNYEYLFDFNNYNDKDFIMNGNILTFISNIVKGIKATKEKEVI